MHVLTDHLRKNMPEFNPHDKDEIERQAVALEELAGSVREWLAGDVQLLGNPLEMGPAALHIVEARMTLLEDLIDALDTAAANLRGTVVITEKLNEWSTWWAEQ